MNTAIAKTDFGRIFEKKCKDIEKIFSSFTDLYNIYHTNLKTARINDGALKAFENAGKSVGDREKSISKELYTQGFLLLTSNAELTLKQMFQCAVTQNFIKINNIKDVAFTVGDIKNCLSNSVGKEDLNPEFLNIQFGLKLYEKLFINQQNSSEKINFQNVNSLLQVYQRLFRISLDDNETSQRIHKYWQSRHCLVHNNGRIDERFINNVRAVNLLKSDEIIDSKIYITRVDYEKAKKDFITFIDHIAHEFEQNDLFVAPDPRALYSE